MNPVNSPISGITIKFELEERNPSQQSINQEIMEILKKVDYYEEKLIDVDKRDSYHDELSSKLRFWQNKFLELTENF